MIELSTQENDKIIENEKYIKINHTINEEVIFDLKDNNEQDIDYESDNDINNDD